ncbi:MAG: bifunctional DNA-formamidopyrimidine glycosylase/DNA-(apurinic or apyrimidinic site) lyase [Armatimonadota bacterium]
MPELPEAETVRRQLEAEVKGRTIRGLELLHRRVWRAHRSQKELTELVEARQIVEVGRRGKAPYLLLDTKRPSVLIFRLGMTGLVRVVKAGEPSDKSPVAVLGLSGGKEIRFYDQRLFGELVAFPTHDVNSTPEFAHYGPEPFSDEFTLGHLKQQFSRRSAKLVDVLMNQQIIAGIGKIYSDEICFRAGVRPGRKASGLTGAERQRLYDAIREVLSVGIESRGSSAKDETYRDIYGIPGRFQDRMMVYQRTGEPCRVCGTPIRRASIASGRGMHWCPKCQK